MRAIAQLITDREEYTPQSPSAVVRICKCCGKHYVGLMRWKAASDAMKLCRDALSELRDDNRERFEVLQTEAAVVIDGSEGACRACSIVKHWKVTP